MFNLPDFTERSARAERMDDPDCDETMLLRTVQQFALINRQVSRYQTILRQWVLNDMLQQPGRSYHLLDMGAGGCDIDVWLLNAAVKLGLNLRVTACDLDPRTIAYAESTYENQPRLEIRQADLLTDPPDNSVDYVFANHFLHHLKEDQIVHLLQHWHPAVRRRMIFNDLLRSPFSYVGFSILSLFYRKSFTRCDGLISIGKGFLPEDFRRIVTAALPDTRSTIHQLHPGRLVLCIDAGAKATKV